MTQVSTIASGRGPYEQTHRILGASGVAIPLTGTTSLTSLVVIPIAAGLIGLNGILRVTTTWSCGNNANAKTARVFFGASGSGTSGTSFLSSNIASTTGTRDVRIIHNRGSASSQIGMPQGTPVGGLGTTTGAHVTATIDTTAATEVCIGASLASGSDTITLEAYLVELIRAD